MKTALFVQEFGANLGHVSRLVVVAKALPSDWRKIFVVPDPNLALSMVKTGCPDAVLFAAPPFYGRLKRSLGPDREHTLADVFFDFGYADVDLLLDAAGRWRNLLDRIRPDLIVSDFAPTLRLSSWNKTPVVAVGDGYATPPGDMPLPSMRDEPTAPEASRRKEEDLLAAARSVREALAGPPLHQFGDLFQGERTFVSSVPSLDPYARFRRTPTVPPVGVADIPTGPPIGERTGPHIFCHFWSGHAAIDTVLTALNGIARPSQVHIRGVDPQLVARNCAPQVGIRTGAADFAKLLPQTRLFIHYGGTTASYMALLAGVLQLVLPPDLEKEITARRLIATGTTMGLYLSQTPDVPTLRRLIEGQLEDRRMQDAAMASAHLHLRTRTRDPVPEIAAACLDLLNAPVA